MSKPTKTIIFVLAIVLLALLLFVGLLFKVYKNFSEKHISLEVGKQKIEISQQGNSSAPKDENNDNVSINIPGKEVSPSSPEVKKLDKLVRPVIESVFGKVKLT